MEPVSDARLAEIEQLTQRGPDGRMMGAWDGDPRADALTKCIADLLTALRSERERGARLREALLGVKERDVAGSPCWCPDWIADDYDAETDGEFWPHHECCLRARAALSEAEQQGGGA